MPQRLQSLFVIVFLISSLNWSIVDAGLNRTGVFPKIAKGEPASHRPYQVQLLVHTGQGYTSVCSGTILNERWILTAAHCIHNIEYRKIQIIAGSQRLYYPDLSEHSYGVVISIEHRDYDKTYNDIALLKVHKTIVFHPGYVGDIGINVSPIYPGQILRVAGWGGTRSTPTAGRIRETVVRVERNEVCSRYGKPLRNTQICANFAIEGSLDCMGDSGGPVTDEEQNSIVGIVSYGYDAKCPSDYPSVYTNVAPYVEWIQDAINHYDSPKQNVMETCTCSSR